MKMGNEYLKVNAPQKYIRVSLEKDMFNQPIHPNNKKIFGTLMDNDYMVSFTKELCQKIDEKLVKYGIDGYDLRVVEITYVNVDDMRLYVKWNTAMIFDRLVSLKTVKAYREFAMRQFLSIFDVLDEYYIDERHLNISPIGNLENFITGISLAITSGKCNYLFKDNTGYVKFSSDSNIIVEIGLSESIDINTVFNIISLLHNSSIEYKFKVLWGKVEIHYAPFFNSGFKFLDIFNNSERDFLEFGIILKKLFFKKDVFINYVSDCLSFNFRSGFVFDFLIKSFDEKSIFKYKSHDKVCTHTKNKLLLKDYVLENLLIDFVLKYEKLEKDELEYHKNSLSYKLYNSFMLK